MIEDLARLIEGHPQAKTYFLSPCLILTCVLLSCIGPPAGKQSRWKHATALLQFHLSHRSQPLEQAGTQAVEAPSVRNCVMLAQSQLQGDQGLFTPDASASNEALGKTQSRLGCSTVLGVT